MVSHVVRPEIGAVGAKLLYEDGRVQHAGVVLGRGTEITHQLRLSEPDDPGPDAELALTRTVAAVTGACLAVRRAVFHEVGGLDEANLAVGFNDIDFCLKLGERGYRVVFTPSATLFHLESVSRGHEDTPEKRERMMRELAWLVDNWASSVARDRFHNANLVLGWNGSELAAPPRRTPPWRRPPP
jgi:GT2 family glycosyltransferase